MPNVKYKYELEVSNNTLAEVEILAESENARDSFIRALLTPVKDSDLYFKDLLSGKMINKNHVVSYELKS